ncbi:MAG: HpcH/HpaI aldolase family protein [Chloroflexota bacterium]
MIQQSPAIALMKLLQFGPHAVGTFTAMPSPSVAEVLALAGFDFLVVDLEHGPISFETAENMLRAADAVKVPCIVRVPDAQPATIMRALDIGAAGVQVPLIETAEQARQVVAAVKYQPEGRRGLALARAARYSAVGPANYFSRANAETIVVVQCETTTAVQNLPEILAVPGVDVVFVGPYDLSQSLGQPGQVNMPEVQAAISEALRTIIASPLTAGSHALSPAHARLLIQSGVRYVTLGTDYLYLLHGCRNSLADARRPEIEG